MRTGYKAVLNALLLTFVAILSQACGGGGGGGGGSSGGGQVSSSSSSSTSSSASSSSSSWSSASISGPVVGYLAGPITKFGEEIHNNGFRPTMAAHPDGRYAVAWVGNTDTVVSFFKSDNSLLLNTAATLTPGWQRDPSITGLPSGGFVVSWSDTSKTDALEKDVEIRAQRFDGNGVKIGTEILVSTAPTLGWANSKVITLSDGGFMVVWRHFSSGVVDDLRGQFFDANGNKRGGELTIKSFGPNIYSFSDPDIAPIADGGFVLSYSASVVPNNFVSNTKVQRYDANGAPVGAEITVNPSDRQTLGSLVAGLKGGGFVVGMNAEPLHGSPSIMGVRVYDSAGNPVGPMIEVHVATHGERRTIRSLIGLATGGFLIAWSHVDNDNPIYSAQVFDASGSKFQNEISFNIKGRIMGYSVAASPNGSFAVTWLEGNGFIPYTSHMQVYMPQY